MSTFRLANASTAFNERADSLWGGIDGRKKDKIKFEYESDEDEKLDQEHSTGFQKERQNSLEWTLYRLDDTPDVDEESNQRAANITKETQTDNKLANQIANVTLNDLQLTQDQEIIVDANRISKKMKNKLILLDDTEDIL